MPNFETGGFHKPSDYVQCVLVCIHSFIHSFWPFLQRPFTSSTTQRRSRLQHGHCIGVSRRRAQATVGKGLSLHGGQSGSRTHDPPVESYRLNQGATMSHQRLLNLDLFSGYAKPRVIIAIICRSAANVVISVRFIGSQGVASAPVQGEPTNVQAHQASKELQTHRRNKRVHIYVLLQTHIETDINTSAYCKHAV